VIVENESDNPTGRIEKIAKEIGVEGKPILESYLELLLAKRSAVPS
jgi:adenylate cyclase class IV